MAATEDRLRQVGDGPTWCHCGALLIESEAHRNLHDCVRYWDVFESDLPEPISVADERAADQLEAMGEPELARLVESYQRKLTFRLWRWWQRRRA